MTEPELVVHIDPEANVPRESPAVVQVSPGRAVLPDGSELHVVDGAPTLEELEARGRITITGRSGD